jgi:hypothetical protein
MIRSATDGLLVHNPTTEACGHGPVMTVPPSVLVHSDGKFTELLVLALMSPRHSWHCP